MARSSKEIETEFNRLKILLNSLPEGKKEMASEIKANMRDLQQEMKDLQEAANAPKTKKKERRSSSVLANMITLVILLFLGVFALTYFGSKLASL